MKGGKNGKDGKGNGDKGTKGKKGKGKGGKSKGKDQTKSGKSTGKSSGVNMLVPGPTGGAAAPTRTVVTYMANICKAYLTGNCNLGRSCPLHHNEPCKKHALGTCTKGANCPFPHWNVNLTQVNATAASQKGAPGGKGV